MARKRRRSRKSSSETPRRRRRRGVRRAQAASPRRRVRRRRRTAREYPHQIRRTKRGRFTSRRRAGKHRTKLVGRITGEPRRRRKASRRRRRYAREVPHQIHRTQRGRFSKSGRSKLVGRITGEARRRRRHTRRRAMENPVNGWEILTGLLAGGFGYVTGDVIDRWLATRDRGKDAQGNTLPTGPATPISTDLLVRGGAGVVVAALPLVGAHFISSPMWRSGLQFFGFGALFHLVGKGVDELGAYLFRDSAADSTGRRLFSTDIDYLKAAGIQGLGAAPGCSTCGRRDGLGACCRSQLPAGPSTGVDRGWRQNMDGSVTPPGLPPVRTTTTERTTTTTEVPGAPIPPVTYVPPTVARTDNRLPGSPTNDLLTSPVAMMPRSDQTVRGLGDVGAAQDVLRRNAAAYRAVQQHASGLRELGQFAPETLAAAAQGLGMPSESTITKSPSPRFTAGSRWSHEKD